VLTHGSRDLFVGEQSRPNERLSRQLEAFDANAGAVHGAERNSARTPPDDERNGDADERKSESNPARVTHSEKKRITETVGDALLKARH